jgi:hypothetical protein
LHSRAGSAIFFSDGQHMSDRVPQDGSHEKHPESKYQSTLVISARRAPAI